MKSYFIALLILLSPLSGIAQDTIVIQNNPTGYVGPARVNKQYKNLIKLNPILFLNGNIPIYWERQIKEKISIELSVGMTTKDFMFEFFYIPALPDGYTDVDSRKYSLGYSASASLKFYPSDNSKALQGFYFAPEVRYRNYTSSALIYGAQVNSLFQSDYVDEYRKFLDGKLVIGYIEDIDDNIILEGYTGIGVRSRDMARAYNVNSGTEIINTKDAKPTFSLGFKIGFAF